MIRLRRHQSAVLALLAITCQLWLGVVHGFASPSSNEHSDAICGDADTRTISQLLAQTPPELRELLTGESDSDCCLAACQICAPLFSPALTTAEPLAISFPRPARDQAAQWRPPELPNPERQKPPATGPPA